MTGPTSKRLLGLAAFVSAIAGCAAVIDLGDTATLRTADAGVAAVEASTLDAGTDAGSSNAGVCGLPDSPAAICSTCIQQKCCDVGMKCAADPTCVAGLQCVKDCLVQVNCLDDCFKKFPSVVAETNCSAFYCPKCTPGTQCSKLGACVFALPSDDLLRNVEEGRILSLDEDQCKQAREQVAGQQSDAGACFGD